MLRRSRRAPRGGALAIISGALVLAAGAGGGSSWARAPKAPGPMLVIAADRIVGFVPFTVSLYGKVTGAATGEIKVCRTEVVSLTDASLAREDDRPHAAETRRQEVAGPVCTPGSLAPARDGYDYAQEMRFDQPGTYSVRLSLTVPKGRPVLSNAVQVRAF